MNALQFARSKMNIDGHDMARRLGIKYEDYRNMYYGKVKIPAEIVALAKALMKEEHATMSRIQKDIFNDVCRQYPYGVMSERDADF